MQKSIYKNLLLVTLATSVLALSACEDKGAKTSEEDPTYDSQTQIEQAATGVDNDMPANDVAIASANDGVAMDNETINDDVAIATADDSEVLDGSESSEHVSTY
ncbi:hypothetical protein [Psychrobacter sp. DM4]|uniref:hypothetical protein n=1 Tax=Psychrobacter sp. DM4 TaxID=3440637 RepID=UPI003F502894